MAKDNRPYWEKLRDGRWQRKRLEVMERDDFTCKRCSRRGDDGATLNVHHKIYRKGRDPWDYVDTDLVTLCEECHEVETGSRARLNEVLSKLGSDEIDYVIGYAISQVVFLAANNGEFDKLRIDADPRNAGEVSGVAAGLGLTIHDPEHDALTIERGWDLVGLFDLCVTASNRKFDSRNS